jgi:predicted site-specific integrase-resolvase
MKDFMSSELSELMTTAEVASLLRVDRSTLSRWRSSGSGPRVTW